MYSNSFMLPPDGTWGSPTRCFCLNISNNHFFIIYLIFYIHQDPDQTRKKAAKESADTVSDYIIHHAFREGQEKIIQQARNDPAENPSYFRLSRRLSARPYLFFL